MNANEIIQAFKNKLRENNFPESIVWLHGKQLHLTKDGLYLYVGSGFASGPQVETIYNKFKNDLDCGATFMLVKTSQETSYCTLLLDSFGSDTGHEIQPNVYLWVDEPYCKDVKIISKNINWFIIKRKPYILSSLDYAFHISQAYT